jgi:hypothetical protein
MMAAAGLRLLPVPAFRRRDGQIRTFTTKDTKDTKGVSPVPPTAWPGLVLKPGEARKKSKTSATLHSMDMTR